MQCSFRHRCHHCNPSHSLVQEVQGKGKLLIFNRFTTSSEICRSNPSWRSTKSSNRNLSKLLTVRLLYSNLTLLSATQTAECTCLFWGKSLEKYISKGPVPFWSPPPKWHSYGYFLFLLSNTFIIILDRLWPHSINKVNQFKISILLKLIISDNSLYFISKLYNYTGTGSFRNRKQNKKSNLAKLHFSVLTLRSLFFFFISTVDEWFTCKFDFIFTTVLGSLEKFVKPLISKVFLVYAYKSWYLWFHLSNYSYKLNDPGFIYELGGILFSRNG